MKIRKSIALGLIAALGIGLTSTPAEAGLDFPDLFQAGAGSSGNARFNGLTGANFNAANVVPLQVLDTGGFLVTLSAVGPAVGHTVVLEAQYNTIPEHTEINYTTANTGGIILDLGPITGNVVLTSIAFREEKTALFGNSFNVNQILTAANANSQLKIQIPTNPVPGLGIPDAQRDDVNIVQLTFTIVGSSGNTLAINTVVNPEPHTMALFGLGLVGLVGVVRRRRKRRADAVADAA